MAQASAAKASSPKIAVADTTKKSSAAKILPCSCASAFQDARYGTGRRVHSLMPGKGYRCSVCVAKKGL